MYRVYIEDFNPPVWAIDDGDPTHQQRFESVVFYAVGSTRYNLHADNVREPKFWIEFPDAELKIFGSTALLR